MSRRIASTTRKAETDHARFLIIASCLAVLLLLIWPPITSLAEGTDTAYNGWILQDATVVSLPEGFEGNVNLEARMLTANWLQEHSRGLSSYTWDYQVQLSWSAAPMVLAAGQGTPLMWRIENSAPNPLMPEEQLAWALYAPELRWAGLGDADTLPCDHSPTYIDHDEDGASRVCSALVRAPDGTEDRMAIILEAGILQQGEWQNIMIQYTYEPATLDKTLVDQVSQLRPVADSTTRFIKNPTTIYCSSDCGIGVWATQA